MTDYGRSDRAAFIANTHPLTSLESKRRKAIEWLGDKWVLHSKHSVKKNPNPGILIRLMS